MSFIHLPPIDAFSFTLGLLCGGVLYFLVIEKKYVQKGFALFKSIYERLAASTNLEKAESLIKKSIFMQAQSNHLVAHAFPLEDILIPPHLIPPPKHLYPEFYTTTASLINQYFPYVPDWPELSAQFPVDLIPYQQLTRINGKIVILGQPGSGKTVLLSALAIHMLTDTKNNLFPILVSAKKILSILENEKDVLQVLAIAFSDQNPQISISQVHYFIKNKITTFSAILMIDDVDHLQQLENEQLIHYLTELETQTKFKKIILAADPNMIRQELLQQYYPLPISAWSIEDQCTYMDQFQIAWNKLPNGQSNKNPVPASIFCKWLHDETLYYSPYDLTLRVWLTNAGYTSGQNIFSCFTNLMEMLKIPTEIIDLLALLAYAMLRTNRSSISIAETNEYFAGVNETLAINSPKINGTLAEPGNRARTKIQESSFKTVLKSPFLVLNPDGRYSFTSPIWAGYFSSLVSGIEMQSWFNDNHLNWTYSAQYMRFATLQDHADTWHEINFQKENRFIFDNSYLKIARIVPDLPADHPVRNGILKWIAKNAFTQPVPAPEKSALFAALLISNDPSLPKLLLDFQSMPDPDLRFLAIIVYAGLSKNDQFDVFINHLSDEDQNVRNAASLAFFALKTKKSTDLLVDILLQGDEYMKQISAETLSLIPSIRKDLLTEALASEDLLIRRAAVFGLARVPEQWASDMLSHAAIEDAQWIVRNAASQIVENRDFMNAQLIPLLPHPSNAPWLISFASKLGKGIPKSGFVKDILLTALDQGNVDEKISAMNYLRVVPDEEIVRAVLALVVHKNRSLQQAATFTLWYIEKILGSIPTLKEKRIT
jgi:hypothetical protein